jgi:hypothetical protein
MSGDLVIGEYNGLVIGIVIGGIKRTSLNVKMRGAAICELVVVS